MILVTWLPSPKFISWNLSADRIFIRSEVFGKWFRIVLIWRLFNIRYKDNLLSFLLLHLRMRWENTLIGVVSTHGQILFPTVYWWADPPVPASKAELPMHIVNNEPSQRCAVSLSSTLRIYSLVQRTYLFSYNIWLIYRSL